MMMNGEGRIVVIRFAKVDGCTCHSDGLLLASLARNCAGQLGQMDRPSLQLRRLAKPVEDSR